MTEIERPHIRLGIDSRSLPMDSETIDCIITDPPWHFNRRITGGKAVHATDYPLLTDEEMAAAFAEMNRVLKKGGHIYAFCPNVKLPVAYGLFAGIGLREGATPKLLVWVKPRIGLGHDYRNQCEFIAFGIKRPYRTTRSHSISTVLHAGGTKAIGSQKPVALYQLFADQSCPEGGTILDPFAGTDPLSQVQGPYRTISADITWQNAEFKEEK